MHLSLEAGPSFYRLLILSAKVMPVLIMIERRLFRFSLCPSSVY